MFAASTRRRLWLPLTLLMSACAGASPPPAASGSQPGASDDLSAARALFEQYVALSDRYDPGVAGLYSDAARIRTRRTSASGQVQELELDGARWKKLIVQAMPIAKQRGDLSKFSNVSVASHADGARITAQRYSTFRCHLDETYFMVVAPDENGTWRIVEESTTTTATSACGVGEGKSLAQRLSEVSERVQALLPLQLDAETRLDTVTHDGSQLTYAHTLRAGDVDVVKLGKLLTPEHQQQTCAEPGLSAVVGAGGRVVYAYADEVGKPLTSVAVTTCRAAP
jgi:hypothetical protein